MQKHGACENVSERTMDNSKTEYMVLLCYVYLSVDLVIMTIFILSIFVAINNYLGAQSTRNSFVELLTHELVTWEEAAVTGIIHIYILYNNSRILCVCVCVCLCVCPT